MASTTGTASTTAPGLCATCAHVKVIRSDRGSTFLRCMLSDTDPHFPKYPKLPVFECAGWIRGGADPLGVHRR